MIDQQNSLVTPNANEPVSQPLTSPPTGVVFSRLLIIKGSLWFALITTTPAKRSVRLGIYRTLTLACV
jgi:hypothetical protein